MASTLQRHCPWGDESQILGSDVLGSGVGDGGIAVGSGLTGGVGVGGIAVGMGLDSWYGRAHGRDGDCGIGSIVKNMMRHIEAVFWHTHDVGAEEQVVGQLADIVGSEERVVGYVVDIE